MTPDDRARRAVAILHAAALPLPEDAELAALKARAEQAERAVAELRAAIGSAGPLVARCFAQVSTPGGVDHTAALAVEKRMQAALASTTLGQGWLSPEQAKAWAEKVKEKCADLHPNIDPASDMERLRGAPGAGAMGAIIEYRDAIRALDVDTVKP